jgi:hypothetical protein
MVRTAASGGIDLVGGFTTLWNNLPNSTSIAVVLSMIAVIIILVTVVPWLWQRRKGGLSGMGGFPWVGVVVAALLAGPAVVFPVLLGIFSLIINLGISGINYVIGLF